MGWQDLYIPARFSFGCGCSNRIYRGCHSMGVTLVLKHKKNALDCIAFEKPSRQFETKLNNILNDCDDKGGFVSVTIDNPKKPRTTGALSQNNLIWRLITIISDATGDTTHQVEEGLKDRAMSKGYPYHISGVTKKPVGNSMATISTVEASYLIDTAYEVIAELGIILEPQDSKTVNEGLISQKEFVDEKKVDTVSLAQSALESESKESEIGWDIF